MIIPHLGLRIEPLSIPGRYFVFSKHPCGVLMADAATVTLLVQISKMRDRLILDDEVARAFKDSFIARTSSTEDDASRRLAQIVAALSAAGIDLEPQLA